MGDKIGSFQVGKQFDSVLLSVEAAGSWLDADWLIDSLTDEEFFQKMMYSVDDRHVKHVYVDGKSVVTKYVKQTKKDGSCVQC
jgi:cytosine/adenosine deaminase-related metal-dependent hydrolase